MKTILAELYIGIDSGTQTGFAIWSRPEKKFICIESMMIHKAMERVRFYQSTYSICVIVEDARLATYNRNNVLDKAKLQGAGSIKRDAAIWQDFLTDMKIPFQMVQPAKAFTKMSAEQFKRTTGWDKVTNEHSRDAGMLVYNR